MQDGCLGTDTLVDFVEGRASAAMRARIEEHASHCDECRRVMSSLARGGATPAVVPPTGDAAPERVGRYRIERELGAGGMGVVYAAFDPELGRTVAVKLLHDRDPATQERLRREAQAMAQLAHPNVVTVHDVGSSSDRMFVAMEHVAGETLARWLVTPRTTAEILEAFRAAGRGLAAAHAAGIVHRDFKPENVLVGTDGRVRVGDFGLARPTGGIAGTASESAEPVSPDAPTTPANLTQTGALVGTPFYLAPERVRGAAADAKSDQYSFCVALYCALYRERPFDGDTLAELATNAEAGRVREPARTRGVPRRVQRAIRRGLAARPDDRFATMNDLLGELALRSRLIVPLAAAVVIAAAGVAWTTARAAAPDERCTGAAAAFAPTWNAERRAAMERAFEASHLPYAAASFQAVAATLDRYAERWIDAHTDACRATQVRNDQTEAMLDRRMVCLAHAQQTAAALIDALASSEPKVVERAFEAARKLPDVAACSDVGALAQIATADGASRVEVDGLGRELAAARAQFEIGQFAPALERTRRIVAAARAIGYRPFEAEAEGVEGGIERALGDDQAAQRSLEASVWAAEAGRADELAARGWAELVFIVGYNQADYDRGRELAQRASAAIARLGGNRDAEMRLEQGLGAIAGDRGKLDEAVAHFTRSVALAEQQYGKDSVEVASALGDLGLAMLGKDDFEPAIAVCSRAVAIDEHAVGKQHPAVARALHDLGNAYYAAGKYALAEQVERRALAIREAAFGPMHRDVGTTLSDLSRAVRRQGRADEALELDRRSIAIAEHAYGPEHPALAQQLVRFGATLDDLGEYAEGTKQLVRAEAIFAKVNGPDHISVVLVQATRADGLLMQEKWREAAALYEHVLPIIASSEAAPDRLAGVATNLALADLELRRPKQALDALAISAQLPRDKTAPANLAAIDFLTARALWESGRDRKRARELAVTARGELAGSGLNNPDELARMDAWIAAHR